MTSSTMRASMRWLLCFTMTLACVPSGAQTLSRYRLVDLGVDVYPHAINESGWIIATSLWPTVSGLLLDGATGAVLREGSYYEAVNDSGDIVGYQGRVPTLWRSTGEVLTLNDFSVVPAINNAGDILGVGPEGESDNGVLLRNGRLTTLGMLGTSKVRFYALNDEGVAIGEAGYRAARWNVDGTGALLPGLGSLDGTSAYAINNLGIIVGRSIAGEGEPIHAVKWVDGSVVDIGMDAHQSVAFGINNGGDIVGQSRDLRDKNQRLTAVLWVGDRMLNLNDLVADRTDVLSLATAINDKGWIAGAILDDRYGHSQSRGFVLVPITVVPEPGVFLLVACGVCVVMLGRPCRSALKDS